MNAKKKIVVAVGAIVLLVIAGVVAVVSVLAARNVTIKSSLNVTYTADKVKATVSASINDGRNNIYKLGSLSFDGTETTTSTPQTLEGGTSDGTLSYEGDIGEVTVEFYFNNNSDKDLIVKLIGKPAENNFSYHVNIYNNVQEETSNSWRILAGENSDGLINIVYHVGYKDKNASLVGDFQWHLSLADPVS